MAGSATQKSTGLKRTASAASSGRSNGGSRANRYPWFALCVDNHGHEGSLWVGKVYQVSKPEPGDTLHDLRVIDEEGEDYLYPVERFVRVDLPPRARKAVQANRVHA